MHLVDACRSLFASMMQEKGLTFESTISLTDLTLEVDRNRMAQVLNNLVSNAVKFSSNHSTIRVVLTDFQNASGQDFVCIEVENQGLSLPENETEAIFEKFVQSSNTRSSSGGTGLGLAICKEIINLHGGEISARNRTPGTVVFTVLLPRKTQAPQRLQEAS